MTKYEYKVHYLRFEGRLADREARLVQELNEVGQQGWRLNRLYPDLGIRTFRSWGGGMNLLLEREIAGP